MENIQNVVESLKQEIGKVVVGQAELLEGILIAIICGGHVLLEGPPGVAKTLLAKTLARTLAISYKRVQFTPDLMPLDVIGANIYDFHNQQFVFKAGPVFTDILLADEINRTPPKTQAALLEAMEEKQVTVDGEIRPLSPVFTVLATQNPLEYEGTYPLPEAQLDRFLLKLLVTYPADKDEIAIYDRYQNGLINESDLATIQPVLNAADIGAMRRQLARIHTRPEIIAYLHRIVKSSREHPLLMLGASPRAGIFLLLAAKARALLNGRDYLIPEDIQELAFPVLRHRLLVRPEAQVDGKSSDLIIKNILAGIPVPR